MLAGRIHLAWETFVFFILGWKWALTNLKAASSLTVDVNETIFPFFLVKSLFGNDGK